MSRECQECGEEIPKARAKALPGCTICVDCQGKAEREGRFARHRMAYKIQHSKDGTEIESMEGEIVAGGRRLNVVQD